MYRLTRTLHTCIVGDTPVLLDETTGKYLMVRGPKGQELTQALHRNSHHDVRSVLSGLGLSLPSDEVTAQSQEWLPARSSHIDSTLLRPRLCLVARIAVLQLWMRWRTKREGFAKTAGRLRRTIFLAGGAVRPQRGHSEIEIASAYAASQTIIGTSRTCLPDSIALARVLCASGHRPTVIIGVQLPIAAHCWVQCEDRLIGDKLEAVWPFRPIWAVK